MTKIRLINKEAFLGTVFIFLFMWALQASNIQVELINVFEQVFENFELTDVYYSKLRSQQSESFEDEVILVNIGNLDRKGIAKSILRLSEGKPKVMGIDATFVGPRPQDPAGDFLLAQALNKVGNSFVMATMPDDWDLNRNEFDTLVMPYAPFAARTDHGHVYTGILTDEDFTTWRNFPTYIEVDGKKEYALSVKLAQKFAPEKTEKFLARNNQVESIYFKGNLDKFIKLDISDFEDPNRTFEIVKDKIVLLGYMGDGYTDRHWDADKFYTPLNNNVVGRGYPDMFGVVVHANIISMILNETYIDMMPDWLSYVLAFLVCYLNAIIFMWIVENRNLAIWYNAITKSIQLLEAIIILSMTMLLFGSFRYHANFALLFLVVLLSGDLIEIFAEIVLRMFFKAKDKWKK
ncbi:CHASE2 domain-containing protein [Flammeovirga agarivorans]|uniref:CHASE2 domain-containing protein n=1 Tax=Flammeovirga agarivorans TaxID=2726742 RepID=A0A7X8SRD7_9BACT|nr:CHASE2 domain-containing protein [Flammeovirga agarivorans]NLR95006.1 CHASE2 domain-containing protein [Flammeovirga agarivorans]